VIDTVTEDLGRWLARVPDDPDRTPVFLFAYAGGGASAWREYARVQPPSLALCPVAVPGREHRIAEPPPERLDDLARDLGEALLPALGRPFAFFGHSFGAILATETARYLRDRHGLSPQVLVTACARPVHLRAPFGDGISGLPDDEFLAALERRTGVPPLAQFRSRPDIVSVFLPPLRCDLALLEGTAPRSATPLAGLVFSIGGADDPDIGVEDLRAWAGYARDGHRYEFLDGGHFVVFEEVDKVLARLAALCGRAGAADSKE
jgi:medium-chain acyl-[acyl-carrier-protein] hydrolase